MAKKKIFITVLFVLIGTGMWAQLTPTPPDGTTGNPNLPRYNTLGGKLELQESPQSVVNASSFRFNSDVDNYLDVIDWSGVEYRKLFFFLGGAADNNAGNFQGGFATKLGSNHLAVYYSGNFFEGDGWDNGSNDSKANKTYGKTTWDNSLALLFANEGIGGIRFDMMFNNVTFADEKNGENGQWNRSQGTGNLVTSLQWGKNLGVFTPKVTLGFQWPDYLTNEWVGAGPATQDKMEMWDNAKLGLKLEAAYLDFEGDYQLTVDFGETTTAKLPNGDRKETAAGYVHNDLNLYYNLTGKVDDKLTVKIRPQFNFQFFVTDGKGEYSSPGINNQDNNSQPYSYFVFSPIVELGAEYALKPTVNLYGGVNVTLLTVDTVWTSEYEHNGAKIKDTPSDWHVAGLTTAIPSVIPSLGVQLKPSEAFSIEMGLNSVIQPTKGSWNFSFNNISGRFALVFKPGAAGSSQ
jgi:hypothetical protein